LCMTPVLFLFFPVRIRTTWDCLKGTTRLPSIAYSLLSSAKLGGMVGDDI
jgi:hypothetical protein